MSNNYSVSVGRYSVGRYSNNSASVAIGNTIIDSTCIALGKNASTSGTDCISIGCNVSTSGIARIQIGSPKFTENEIWMSNINIRGLQDRIEQLETIIEKQSKLIDTLWYAPGMPGYQEAFDMWDKDAQTN